MSKIASILLASILLLQSMHLGMEEVTQFDELLEHAKFHSEKYGDNFLVFLSKHYGELQQEHEKEHREEMPEHEKLPLHHHNCIQSLADFIVLRPLIPVIKSNQTQNTSAQFYYQESYTSLEAFDIFQPPKAA